MARDFRNKNGVLLCFSVFVLGSYCVDALNTIYMDNLCGKEATYNVKLNVMTSGILTSDRKNSWNKEVDCTVAFIPQPGDMVVLSLYKYTLAPGDELMITDHDDHKVLLQESGSFQDERKSFTSEGLITVRYKTNSSVESVPGGGFQLTFTQAKELPCLPNYFQCDNKRCIEAHLACDGHNHCGDNSDQVKCVPKQPPKVYIDQQAMTRQSIAITISISVSLLVTVSLFIILIVYAVQRRKERNNIRARAVTNPRPSTSRAKSAAPGRDVSVVSESMQKSDVVVGVGGDGAVVHQVPPLYPHLAPGVEQPPTAPDFEEGHVNPAFAPKE